MSLFVDVGLADALRIGDDTVIYIERKSGQRARLRIDGSAKVELLRKEKDKRMLNPPAENTGD